MKRPGTVAMVKKYLEKSLSKSRDFLTISPIRTFGILAGMFGTFLILLVPPFAGADEEAHFVRAYGISKGDIVIYHGERVEIPTSYRQTLGCLQVKRVEAGATYTYLYNQYGQDKKKTFNCFLNIRHDSRDTELINTTAANYAALTYTPQVLAISVGNLLNAPPVLLSYLARFSVLVAYILLISFAIKLVPIRKWALVGVALLPPAIIHVTNPGADYMLLGATAVFLAAIMRSRLQSFEFSRRSIVLHGIATLAAVLMVFTKGIFPGFCFLPLLLFFGGIKKYLLLKVATIIAISFIGYVWQKVALMSAPAIPGVSNSIFEFPYAFIKTMFYGWFDKDFIYVESDMGLDNQMGMPAVFVTVMNILLALYIFVSYTTDKLELFVRNKEHKVMLISMCGIAGAVIIGSFAVMYIAVVGFQNESGTINGVQARYFYPAFIMLAIMPFARKIQAPYVSYTTIVVLGSTSVLTTLVIMVALRYDWF